MKPAGGRKVLVVEDEGVLRASMVAGLAKLREANVVGVGSVADAIANLDGVDLVVSDIDLPDGLGVQLIGELARRKSQAPIIFVTAYRAAYGSLIPPHAAVEVLEKPVSLEVLRQAVAARLGSSGPPSPFSVADYVQLACMGKHSVSIDVEWPAGSGRIDISGGELWSASDPEGRGEPAFRRLAFRRDVTIRCFANEAEPPERDIQHSWEAVLMDSAREHDEEQRRSSREMRASRPIFDLSELGELADPMAAPSTPLVTPVRAGDTTLPSVQPVRPAPPVVAAPVVDPLEATETDGFHALFDQAVGVLLSRDYRAAAALFAQARILRPDDARVNANLKRLRDMGYEAADGGPDRRERDEK